MLLQTKEASLMIKKRKMCTQYPSSTRMQNEKFRKDYKHEEKLEKFEKYWVWALPTNNTLM